MMVVKRRRMVVEAGQKAMKHPQGAGAGQHEALTQCRRYSKRIFLI